MASVVRRLRARAALTRQERASIEADGAKFGMSPRRAIRSFLKFVEKSRLEKAEPVPLFGFSKSSRP